VTNSGEFRIRKQTGRTHPTASEPIGAIHEIATRHTKIRPSADTVNTRRTVR
jgi:hypothetical protein